MAHSNAASTESGLIEIRVREAAQIFNSMDPSPFPERDLDHQAEEFIVGWAQEYPMQAPLRIKVHLSHTPPQPDVEQYITNGIRNYFAYKVQITRRRFARLMSRGRISLLIGLSFLIVCLGGADVALMLGQTPIFQIVSEGFIIAGWVAMWRPMEIFLYDWWPLMREHRIFDRLSRAAVEVTVHA